MPGHNAVIETPVPFSSSAKDSDKDNTYALDKLSMEMSDNEAANRLQIERRKLFKTIFEQDKKYA